MRHIIFDAIQFKNYEVLRNRQNRALCHYRTDKMRETKLKRDTDNLCQFLNIKCVSNASHQKCFVCNIGASQISSLLGDIIVTLLETSKVRHIQITYKDITYHSCSGQNNARCPKDSLVLILRKDKSVWLNDTGN